MPDPRPASNDAAVAMPSRQQGRPFTVRPKPGSHYASMAARAALSRPPAPRLAAPCAATSDDAADRACDRATAVALPRPEPTGQPEPALPPMTRLYQASWLDASGGIAEIALRGPALAQFEDRFAALARGALIATANGLVAVEDLVPGDVVHTATGPATLLWKGMVTLPCGSDSSGAAPLYRVPADAFGPDLAGPDLLLGPAARVVTRGAQSDDEAAASHVGQPISALVDGGSVIAISPPSPVTLYHLGFAERRSLSVGGLELESVPPHPTERETLVPALARLHGQLCPALPLRSGGRPTADAAADRRRLS